MQKAEHEMVVEPLARERVLIVEDDRDLSEYLFRFIATLGYSIQVAESFEDALVRAQAWQPHHVLLDVRIPGGSGLSLIRPLREIDPTMNIILCTGSSSITTNTAAVKLGADGYLPKPVLPEQLIAAFERSDAPPESSSPGSFAQARWEYMHMVLADCHGDMAEAARHLGVDAESLERVLKKDPPTA